MTPNSNFWTKLRRWLFYCSPIVFLLCLIGGPVEQLLFGWIYFPLRVFPKVSPDWPTAILGLISGVAFVAMLHLTLRWFVREASPSTESPVVWSWGSTIIASTMVVLMFAAGTAMVGVTHQTIWLFAGQNARPEDREAFSQRTIVSLTDLVGESRESTSRIIQKNNLKSLGLAIANVVEINGGRLPPGGVMVEDGSLLHGWPIFLSGYLSYYDYGKIDFDTSWNSPPNDVLFQCEVSEFVNPSQTGPLFDKNGYGLSHVAGNVHVLPVLTIKSAANRQNEPAASNWRDQMRDDRRTIKLDEITDGLSNTLLVGTVAERFKPWAHPANVRDPALGINRSPEGFGGPPAWSGGMFAICDGSVKFLSEKIDPKIMGVWELPMAAKRSPMTIGTLDKQLESIRDGNYSNSHSHFPLKMESFSPTTRS